VLELSSFFFHCGCGLAVVRVGGSVLKFVPLNLKRTGVATGPGRGASLRRRRPSIRCSHSIYASPATAQYRWVLVSAVAGCARPSKTCLVVRGPILGRSTRVTSRTERPQGAAIDGDERAAGTRALSCRSCPLTLALMHHLAFCRRQLRQGLIQSCRAAEGRAVVRAPRKWRPIIVVSPPENHDDFPAHT